MTASVRFTIALLCLAAAALAAPADKPVTRTAPKSPEESLRTITVQPGFHVELVAAEPLIRTPVAIDFDEDGRMYVVQYTEYNDFAATRPHGTSSIRLLEDRDGDGRYEHAIAFADDVKFATGMMCYDGGVFVTAAPDILYLKDTDGDGRADVRERIYTGFDRDHAGEAMLNSLRWGPDNRIHVSVGLAGGMIQRVDRPQDKPISIRNLGMAFDPRTREWTLAGGAGQYGMTMDDWGHKFACSNSMPVWQVMYDNRYLARNPVVIGPNAGLPITPIGPTSTLHRKSAPEAWRESRDAIRARERAAAGERQPNYSYFSSASGLTVYRGSAFPEKYRGNIFVGEVAANLVHRFVLEPNGAAFKAVDADGDAEFLASTDNWFRPVQIAPSPDGCLCVVDMYRELIEGADFLPASLLKQVDPSGGIDRGRIYRIVPDGFVRPKAEKWGSASTAALVGELLFSDDGWHRDRAARLLCQRRDPAAGKDLEKWQASSSPLGRMHALYSLATIGALNPEAVIRGLNDPDARVREHAAIVAEHLPDNDWVCGRLMSLADDPSPAVRRQVAFSLGYFPQPGVKHALASIAVRDVDDSWTRLAVLCSSAGRGGQLAARLTASDLFCTSSAGQAMLGQLAEQIGAAHQSADIERLLAVIESLPAARKPLAQQLVKRLMLALPPQASGLKLKGTCAKLWNDALALARRVVDDPKQSPAARAAAVQTLVFLPLDEVRPLLAGLLAADQPEPVQAAVLKQISRYHQPEVAEIVLSAWSGLGPKMRSAAVELLLARAAWAGPFLDAIEQKRVARAEIDPGRVQLLAAFPDAEIRRRAKAAFAADVNEARAAVVAKYQPALAAAGDVERGRAVFRKQCAACHRLEQFGTALGAELAAIGDRGKEAVLLNILDPNREVKPRYLVYTVATVDGQVIAGLISGETATSMTFVQSDGQRRTLLRSDIDELTSSGRSFMPEGLEKQVTLADMIDLLAYLAVKK
jgi:putative membrane-bound dehydrogenase-like protein